MHYAEKLEKMVTVADRIDRHRGAYFYQGIITPAIMEMRFGFWNRAVEIFDKIVDSDSIYGQQAMDYKTAFSLFSSGMSALNAKKISEAKSRVDQLDALFWRNAQLENEKDRLDEFKLKTLMISSMELKGNILVAEKKYN